MRDSLDRCRPCPGGQFGHNNLPVILMRTWGSSDTTRRELKCDTLLPLFGQPADLLFICHFRIVVHICCGRSISFNECCEFSVLFIILLCKLQSSCKFYYLRVLSHGRNIDVRSFIRVCVNLFVSIPGKPGIQEMKT